MTTGIAPNNFLEILCEVHNFANQQLWKTHCEVTVAAERIAHISRRSSIRFTHIIWDSHGLARREAARAGLSCHATREILGVAISGHVRIVVFALARR